MDSKNLFCGIYKKKKVVNEMQEGKSDIYICSICIYTHTHIYIYTQYVCIDICAHIFIYA